MLSNTRLTSNAFRPGTIAPSNRASIRLPTPIIIDVTNPTVTMWMIGEAFSLARSLVPVSVPMESRAITAAPTSSHA